MQFPNMYMIGVLRLLEIELGSSLGYKFLKFQSLNLYTVFKRLLQNYGIEKLPQATVTMRTYRSKMQINNPFCGLQIHFA